MPLSWECKDKLVKQVPLKPTVSRKPLTVGSMPGPGEYTTPEILGGKGYSKIKRAPAYSMGYKRPGFKPMTNPNARILNVEGLTQKGASHVPGGTMSPRPAVPNVSRLPGPADYVPNTAAAMKKPPAYSCGRPHKAAYHDKDQWTPSPNMYWPPPPGKKPPKYTFGHKPRDRGTQSLPAPGQYNPNFYSAMKAPPAFSLKGLVEKKEKIVDYPAPNAYCHKRFFYPKNWAPAPSFGIRHSPFLGQQRVYLKPSEIKND